MFSIATTVRRIDSNGAAMAKKCQSNVTNTILAKDHQSKGNYAAFTTYIRAEKAYYGWNSENKRDYKPRNLENVITQGTRIHFPRYRFFVTTRHSCGSFSATQGVDLQRKPSRSTMTSGVVPAHFALRDG